MKTADRDIDNLKQLQTKMQPIWMILSYNQIKPWYTSIKLVHFLPN